MLLQSVDCRRLVLVRLNPGDDLLRSLEAAVRANGIRTGLILNGVGSLNRYHVHVVATPVLPPRDVFIRGEGAYDILSLSGMVSDGRVHAHISFADAEKALGGHMEEGCRVLTFAAIMLADTPDAKLSGWDHVGPL